MKTAIKSTLAVAATAAAIAGVAAVPSMVSAYNARPTYFLQEVSEGKLGNTITFNSIKIADSDYEWHKNTFGKEVAKGTIRNELNFVGVREKTGVNAGVDNVWYNDIKVEDGKTYIVRLYVHNNNPNGTNAVAEDTKVSFSIPSNSAKTLSVNGWLTASNTSPKEYVSYADFTSDVPFHLEYQNGSALLENGGIGKGAGVKLSDEIVQAKNGGVLIGYDALDGKVPGCYEYTNYVTIEVKAVFDYEYTIEKKVRIAGDADKTWKDTVDAKVGDKVEFQLTYKNTSDQQQNNVKIRDILPKNLRYVENSTKLKNSTFPNAASIVDGKPSDILQGINIGDYAPGANAKIMFTAEVVDESLECGSNTLVNWGQAGVNDQIVQDYARVHLTKVCENKPDEPTPEEPETPVVPEYPNAGPTAIAGGVIATGSIATAAGYYIASRRQLR